MKCDELKAFRALNIDEDETGMAYPKAAVDSAIDKLKARIHDLESMPHTDNSAVIEKLVQENERLVKCCKEYDSRQRIDEQIKFNAAKQLRATKRTLWLARAERAKTEYNHWILIWHCELNNHLFFINKTRYKNRAKVDRMRYPCEWRDIWSLVEQRCLKKAEEYK